MANTAYNLSESALMAGAYYRLEVSATIAGGGTHYAYLVTGTQAVRIASFRMTTDATSLTINLYDAGAGVVAVSSGGAAIDQKPRNRLFQVGEPFAIAQQGGTGSVGGLALAGALSYSTSKTTITSLGADDPGYLLAPNSTYLLAITNNDGTSKSANYACSAYRVVPL